MARRPDLRKLREWRRRMARFQKKQQAVAEFCQDEGVSVASFYQWRKKLAEREQPDETVGAHKASVQKASSPAGFAAVRVIGSVGIDVRLPGGTQLHVPTSDPDSLRLVIHTLAGVDAEHAGGEAC